MRTTILMLDCSCTSKGKQTVRGTELCGLRIIRKVFRITCPEYPHGQAVRLCPFPTKTHSAFPLQRVYASNHMRYLLLSAINLKWKTLESEPAFCIWNWQNNNIKKRTIASSSGNLTCTGEQWSTLSPTPTCPNCAEWKVENENISTYRQ